MKKFILLPALLLSTHILAESLHSFNEVKNAADSGKTIHFAADFLKCTTTDKRTNASELVGTFAPDVLQISDNYIAASFTHFTLNNPGFTDRPVVEFVSYKVTPENNMVLTSQILNAVDYAALTPKFTYNCKLDIAVKVFA